MPAIDVAIIGAGQAGLSLSHCLGRTGIEHIVIDRGSIGGRWLQHGWDSLRLLTPNWMNGLPGSPYAGDDPDGFMARDAFVARLTAYSAAGGAPVIENTDVIAVEPRQGGFAVVTDRRTWIARAVVVATGHCDLASVPGAARGVSPRVMSLHASQYRSTRMLADGAVLVVGASSSGVQIADEISRSGRDVVLAVGRHTRLPRSWRGRDIFWWLHRMGILDEPTRAMPDPEAVRRQPSLQLAGRMDRDMDLAALQSRGVRLAGRILAVEGDGLAFDDDLASSVAAADAKVNRLLARIDGFAGIDPGSGDPELAPVDLSRPAPRRLSLRAEGIGTVVWATGYRRAFPWLKLPASGEDGELVHDEGVCHVPGLFALGFRLLRKRDSNFIGGAGSDAIVLAQRISGFLGQRARRAA